MTLPVTSDKADKYEAILKSISSTQTALNPMGQHCIDWSQHSSESSSPRDRKLRAIDKSFNHPSFCRSSSVFQDKQQQQSFQRDKLIKQSKGMHSSTINDGIQHKSRQCSIDDQKNQKNGMNLLHDRLLKLRLKLTEQVSFNGLLKEKILNIPNQCLNTELIKSQNGYYSNKANNSGVLNQIGIRSKTLSNYQSCKKSKKGASLVDFLKRDISKLEKNKTIQSHHLLKASIKPFGHRIKQNKRFNTNQQIHTHKKDTKRQSESAIYRFFSQARNDTEIPFRETNAKEIRRNIFR